MLIVLSIICCMVATPLERYHESAAGRRARSGRSDPSWEADWNAIAQQSLQRALEQQQLNTNVAKNVILFLGDGMGVSTVTAGRIYDAQLKGQHGEESFLAFEKFPHVALSKTYNVDSQVPDSAGTATAYLCGEKADLGVIGVSQRITRARCDTMSLENNLDSILHWSLAEGKKTGVVTTTRVTHATPAAAYAHSADRDWEDDGDVPAEDRNKPLCRDIALQLISDNSNISVILGGGRQQFMPRTAPDPEYPSRFGARLDGIDLIETWKLRMTEQGNSHAYVWRQTEFDQVDPATTDYLFGLFEPSHMRYTLQRNDPTEAGEPTLAEMTEKAIRILSREDKGFFLLVEGGRIDHANHDNSAKNALTELVEFNKAVEKALTLTSTDDTLIVITADHSHVLTMAGYPTRGNPILAFVDEAGLGESSALDRLPYTSLSYANGRTGVYGRSNMTGQDPTADDFLQQSLVWVSSETHGGEDVAIYASGPMSHLFQGVQEQNYVAHAMAYASCVGVNKGHCGGQGRARSSVRSSAAAVSISSMYILLATALFKLFMHCMQ